MSLEFKLILINQSIFFLEYSYQNIDSFKSMLRLLPVGPIGHEGVEVGHVSTTIVHLVPLHAVQGSVLVVKLMLALK